MELVLAFVLVMTGLGALGWALSRRSVLQLTEDRAEPPATRQASAAELIEHLGAKRVPQKRNSEQRTRLSGQHRGLNYGLKVWIFNVEVHVRTDCSFDGLGLACADGPPDDIEALSRLSTPVRALVRSLAAEGRVVHRDGFVAIHAAEKTAAEVESLIDRTTHLTLLLKAAPSSQADRLAHTYLHEGDEAWKRNLAHAVAVHHPDSPVMSAMLLDPDADIRVVASIALRRVPELVDAVVSTPAIASTVFGALKGTPEFWQVLSGAAVGGADLSDPDNRWALEQVIVHPTAKLQPVLLVCTRMGSADFQRSAVHSLAQVGTIAAVPTLRALAEGWTKPRLAAAATEAIEAIRARAGAHPGAVSVAESAGGGLSVTDSLPEGRLADSGEPDSE